MGPAASRLTIAHFDRVGQRRRLPYVLDPTSILLKSNVQKTSCSAFFASSMAGKERSLKLRPRVSVFRSKPIAGVDFVRSCVKNNAGQMVCIQMACRSGRPYHQ